MPMTDTPTPRPTPTQTPGQRRRRRERYDVGDMPPPWRRSLTESGMVRRTTRTDVIAVAVFAVLFVALFAFLATQT